MAKKVGLIILMIGTFLVLVSVGIYSWVVKKETHDSTAKARKAKADKSMLKSRALELGMSEGKYRISSLDEIKEFIKQKTSDEEISEEISEDLDSQGEGNQS